MYLKCLEVHGFKSFANKIVFDFHNGITGIVGPNGSGKSNVADAVRWVLGEQSPKQLRGASMQDVIFAGTENRNPQSYAYVSITLDNSDHQLALDYEEVTIARRVYRSGESEYLINGNVCRLKEVKELFYDTGIGKEGYSIIGQGQIDRILSNKPEERRELFDEAAGIVKFKQRKISTQKNLETERENLVRVNDILAELERQVGPLERQSEKAKTYLKKREELKTYDINMFLLESERIKGQTAQTDENYAIADKELNDVKQQHEQIRGEYEKLQEEIATLEDNINNVQEQINHSSVTKEKLESQISLLREQIHTAEMTDEHLNSRLSAIEAEKNERLESRKEYEEKKNAFDEKLKEISARKLEASDRLAAIQEEIARCNSGIESGQAEMIRLLNNKASIKARQQKMDTMLEQTNIRKAELNQRLLSRKSREAEQEAFFAEAQKAFEEISESLKQKKDEEAALVEKNHEWKQKALENTKELELVRTEHNKVESRLESLRNIAERYEGYGNSTRRVMEQKEKNPGVLGVVSDLISTDKKYETAIETALGGNIQNIVTEDEACAKSMIRFLKENRLGRATFLPLTSVRASHNDKNRDSLKEQGVLGIASELVHCDEKYKEVAAYLLGRVLVLDSVDHALALAKKNHYSQHMVTLEGEYLSPGGSLTGGAFKNNSNLLGRKREIEELEKRLKDLDKKATELNHRKDEIDMASALGEEELNEVRIALQKLYIDENTAKLNLEQAKSRKEESDKVYENLRSEGSELDGNIREITAEKQKIEDEENFAKKREVEIAEEKEKFDEIIKEQSGLEEKAVAEVSAISLEEANVIQRAGFVQENMERIDREIEKFNGEKEALIENAKTAKGEVEKKRFEIEEIQKTILAGDETYTTLSESLKKARAEKEEKSNTYRGFFQKQEDISKRETDLEKEIVRLSTQQEKLREALDYQTNYIWEAYELTPHAAEALRNEEYNDLSALKKLISGIKDDIRALGDVNVNAIEEYKEVSERYEFLKKQHDDLVIAEERLVEIIEELDEGMRKQFSEKFADIQKEFDKTFKHLFGGGHGTLELQEDEDILEAGIKVVAQPPGKKLQNMMQLSGGEKALTAIALLFAIQALKPSPFCLLDEIEAALDDSNVVRFSSYLQKLTKDTQFIVITHRRGTMNAADRLYGITMQEKGVSTLVSVNLIESDLDK
ncbi:MAG: chromosome segregation protein SMC [Lachnospiraceae bacterium]|nr:chromosome segregation protein SMC [Lachnospiraceae bacterium]